MKSLSPCSFYHGTRSPSSLVLSVCLSALLSSACSCGSIVDNFYVSVDSDMAHCFPPVEYGGETVWRVRLSPTRTFRSTMRRRHSCITSTTAAARRRCHLTCDISQKNIDDTDTDSGGEYYFTTSRRLSCLFVVRVLFHLLYCSCERLEAATEKESFQTADFWRREGCGGTCPGVTGRTDPAVPYTLLYLS